MDKNLYALRRKKLDELLVRNTGGFSYEEMVGHYTSLSFFAMHCAVCTYMQTASLLHAEDWFCLSALARRTANAVLCRSPRWEPAPLRGLPMDDLAAALLCGQTAAALDLLRMVPRTIEREKVPLWNGKPDTRIDQKQGQHRRQRLTLESALYAALLQDDSTQARQALTQLEHLGWDPVPSQALCALLEDDAAGFAEALVLHMKDFRADPGELDHSVLFWEALWQRRGGEPPMDLADAPAALLKLPASDPAQLAETLGLPLPSFDPEAVLALVDKNKVGPKFFPL